MVEDNYSFRYHQSVFHMLLRMHFAWNFRPQAFVQLMSGETESKDRQSRHLVHYWLRHHMTTSKSGTTKRVDKEPGESKTCAMRYSRPAECLVISIPRYGAMSLE